MGGGGIFVVVYNIVYVYQRIIPEDERRQTVFVYCPGRIGTNRERPTTAGNTRSWNTVKQILQTHQVVTIVLPDADGTHVHHIRAATEPDAAQKEIYEKPVSFSQGDHPF